MSFTHLPEDYNMHNCIKHIRTILLVALIVLGCSTAGLAETLYPVTFTDDLGKEITVKAPATRIISFYSAHTENLFALGLDEEIIGVGTYDIYPPKARTKPIFDYRSDPEKTIAAAPDLVLIRSFIKRSRPEFVEALEKAGLQVVALYPERFETFDEYIRRLALLTGKTAYAEQLLKTFHQNIEDIQNRTRNITPKMNVYFESVERGYKTVTPDSMPGQAIAIAGGVNIAQDVTPVKKGSTIATYGVEHILEHADDIDVYLSQRGAMHAGGSVHSISIRPGFYAIKAIQNKRIHVINEKLISSPTFRYVKGILELARMFYPEIMDNLSEFQTDDVMTREMMAEVAVRFKHRPIFVPTSRYYRKKHKGHTYGTFQDVHANHPRFDFIETAVFAGYMDSIKEDGRELFHPTQKITRDELARIIFILYDVEQTRQHTEIHDLEHVSKPQIVQMLVDRGIMTCNDGYFQPEEHVTGHDVLKILARLKTLK